MINFVITLFILQMLDVLTTLYGISIGIQEHNPYMVEIVSRPILFLGIKLASIPLFSWIILVFFKNYPKIAMAMKAYCIGLMAFVVIGNIYTILTW